MSAAAIGTDEWIAEQRERRDVIDEWLSLRLDYSAAVTLAGPRSSAGRKAAEALTDYWRRHASRYKDLMCPISEEDIPW
jgi:hypothetical protein